MDYDRFVAGFCGGLAFQLLHPFDLVRTRLQTAVLSQDKGMSSRYKGYIQAVRSIRLNEGKRGLFKGSVFSFVTNIMVGGFFAVNDYAKKRLRRSSRWENKEGTVVFLSAFGSSFFFAALMTPFYVVKTWKLLDTANFNKTDNVFRVVRNIVNDTGYKGFFRGFAAMLAMGFNGTLTVTINDHFKLNFGEFYSTPAGNFVLGGTARLISSSIFYPISTVRSRMMQKQKVDGSNELKYKNITDCLRKTLNEEGVRGFYGGFLANGFRAFLSSALLFTVYERVYRYLKQRKIQNK